jgi:hypothetical protein
MDVDARRDLLGGGLLVPACQDVDFRVPFDQCFGKLADVPG